mmetsp:Transcript_25886/g.75727  ORF Transcript_25886/g.75727 Transcript_25886/m.75727 type:complete len:360 (-) Transcript_25886:488-1567(-)
MCGAAGGNRQSRGAGRGAQADGDERDGGGGNAIWNGMARLGNFFVTGGGQHDPDVSAGRQKLLSSMEPSLGRTRDARALRQNVKDGKLLPFFVYGSNNVEQLRLKLELSVLNFHAAVLPNYVRVFGGPNKSWSVGGRLGSGGRVSSASLHEQQNASTLGSMVLVPAELVQMLHEIEGHPSPYQLILVDIRLQYENSTCSESFPAMTYKRVTAEFVGKVPQAYLCATLRTIKESFPNEPETILIIKAGVCSDPSARNLWTHPAVRGGFKSLELPAFLYEVGARKEPKWAMPKTIDEVIDKLDGIGWSPLEKSPSQFVDDIEAINARLREQGKSAIGNSTIELARYLLGLESYEMSIPGRR